VDLLPLARRYYCHPRKKGSWSIKAILPTIAPDLNYEALGKVQDGPAAQMAYLEAIASDTEEKPRNEAVRNLKDTRNAGTGKKEGLV